jgi:hypothetical protein
MVAQQVHLERVVEVAARDQKTTKPHHDGELAARVATGRGGRAPMGTGEVDGGVGFARVGLQGYQDVGRLRDVTG